MAHPKSINLSPLKRATFWLAVLAGLLYSSWPLGYMLNPVTAHSAFASELEAAHQPYNWLFVALDITSGITMLILGLMQWRKATGTLLRTSIIAYSVFALLVIVAALVPFNCNSQLTQCGDMLHSPLLLIHGLASVVSVGALFVSLVTTTLTLLGRLRSLIGIILSFVGAAWGICGLAGLLLWHSNLEVLVQYIFVSICSLSTVASIGLIGHVLSPMRIEIHPQQEHLDWQLP